MMATLAKWLAAAGAVLLAACNPVEQLGDADEAVTEFHRHLDAADFDGIWRATHEEFKAAQPRESYNAFMTSVHEQLGNVASSERQGFNINTNNGVTTVSVNMFTKFARGEANEEFVFVRDGDRLELLNYAVKPAETPAS